MNLEETKQDILKTLSLYYEFEIIDLSDSGGTLNANELSLMIKSKDGINKDEIINRLKNIGGHLHVIVYNDMVAILVDVNEAHIF